MAQWDKEFDDIDFYGGEAFFIMDDSQNMIEIRYHDGMFIDVGLDSDNIYNITVLGSNDSEGLNSPLCVVKISEREKLHDKLQEIIWRFREGVKDDDETENRTAELLDKYGLDFMNVPAGEIRELLTVELKAPADAEYIRLLCAYLFCAGGKEDATELDYCPPCGVCRQVMSEFCKDDFKIFLVKSETEYKEYTLTELVPERFTPNNLLG